MPEIAQERSLTDDTLLNDIFGFLESVAAGTMPNEAISTSWGFGFALLLAQRHPEWAQAVAERYRRQLPETLTAEVGDRLVELFPVGGRA